MEDWSEKVAQEILVPPDPVCELFALCGASRSLDGPWLFPSLRVALRARGDWYSAFGWPSLPDASWLPGRAGFSGDLLPSVEDLLALALSPCAPRALPQGHQQQDVQQQGVQQQAPALPFVPVVPPRCGRPNQRPASWNALQNRMARFEVKPDVMGYLVSDFLHQLQKDKHHVEQFRAKWRQRVARVGDSEHFWRLSTRVDGVSGMRPWVATETCLRQVYDCFF